MKPAGTEAAGWPVKLNGSLNAAQSIQSQACCGQCSGFRRPTGNAATESVVVAIPLVAGGIPKLSEWGMIILAGLLALFGFVAVRRQAR